MTRDEVEKEIMQYRTIFPIVRLLDAGQVCGNAPVEGHCPCHELWHKDDPCQNCISRQVMEDHAQRTKLEYMGRDLYQVTAVYREVDGAPCVLELIQPLDCDNLIDPENSDRLMSSVSGYHIKLYHDALTGCYNRRYYEDIIKGRSEPAGVAVLDLDDFKLYNDTYGHQAGDAALRTAVEVVRGCIRKSDHLIRYGGDEFLLVLPGIAQAAFVAKLERIRQQLHTAVVPGYTRLQISASIGGVMSRPGESCEQAASRADRLMYQAKNHKNTVVTEDTTGAAAPSAAGRDRQARQNILIVDDSEMNRAILAEILGSDYNILEASNGQECLTMLDQYDTAIALILLDIVMPVMDGFTCCAELRKRKETAHIPILLLTAKAEDKDSVEASYRGADDYVRKPFNPEVLLAKVAHLLDMRRRLKQIYTRTLLHTSSVSAEKPEGTESEFMQQVLSCIEGHASNPEFNVKVLAGELHMSQATLYRKLKQHTDLSAVELIRHIRMTQAAFLLMETSLPVTEVAERVGFNDLPTFRKHFTDMFGVSPSKYAEDNQKNK